MTAYQVNIDRHSIVVGVADTPESRAALDWAAREADSRRRSLMLVHAIGDEVSAWLDLGPEDARDVIATQAAAAEQLLADARAHVNQLTPGVGVHQRIPLSGAKASLRDLSRHAELLVLGNHSAMGHLTGAIDVIEPFLDEHLECPVVLVGHRCTPGDGILVVADGTPASVPTLVYAFSQARRSGQRLTVTLCLADPPPTAVAQDLALMDETARMEAALGSSLLGLERSLLQVQVADLRNRFFDVEVSLAHDDALVDDLLARAADCMDTIIADASYVRRLRTMTDTSTSADLGPVTTVLPAARPGVTDMSLELEALLEVFTHDGEASPGRALPLPEPSAPEVTPAREPVPVRVVRRRVDERGPWKYFRRHVDDPDVT